MFTTINDVKELTNVDVTIETVNMAQAIIESFVGRTEAEVTNANDLALLGRATAYQAAYMFGDEEKVFSQMKASSVMQYGNQVTFSNDGVSPWVAPLAVIACRRLTWKRMRSIKTGSIYATPVDRSRWSTE